MNIFLIILLIIGGLIALLLIIALFAPKKYRVERSIVINAPAPAIFEYTRFLKNQDNFSKWVMLDPAMQKTFTGTDGAPGFIYAWDGNKKAGKGEQEIKSVRNGQGIDIEIRFIKPFSGIAQGKIDISSIAPQQSKVNWSFDSSMAYPMNAMLLFLSMEKMIGKDLEITLSNLKSKLESGAA